MEESNQEMNVRIAQQQAMLEQQRQDELLRLQHSAIHEIAKESMTEHEKEMQRQMMSVPPPGTNIIPPLLPPPAAPSLLSSSQSNSAIPSLMSTPMQRPPLLPPPGMPPQLLNMNWNEGPPGTKDISPPGMESSQTTNELPSLLSLHVEKPDELKNKNADVVLPKALEQVLALKDQRVAELGSENDVNLQEKDRVVIQPVVLSSEYANDDNDSDDDADLVPPPPPAITSKSEGRQNKNKKKKEKKKRARTNKEMARIKADEANKDQSKTKNGDVDVEVEYIQESLALHELAPMHRQFYKIFEAFKIAEKSEESAPEPIAQAKPESKKDDKNKDKFDDDEDMDEKPVDDKEKMSKRKLKKLTRLSVAELKQLVSRPDVVEMHDVTARDPKLLVQLKAHRNTVQVPRHWCCKRKYLQGKRGIEKPAFDLPAFIKKTGIMEMRASLQDKDESKTLKAKMRERARPKLGKIDIDYQKLHDAFFKWQTKPRMTIHGDLYYEGKEFETRLKEKKPGDLSDELKTALGMPIGPGSNKIPPPWLIAQQRYGPPPSYPNLKIPGLNAPIPDACSFGYHTGGWGKPPVDEKGKPLYGDVFGVNLDSNENEVDEAEIDRTVWGEMESESEESSSEEEEEDETQERTEDVSGLVTPAEGLVTPSGFSSIPTGMETPETIELRKKKIENDMDGGETPVLYQVLPERRTDRIGGAMMASTHVYDMTGAGGAQPPSVIAAKRGITHNVPEKEGAVELALDPSELDMDNDAMAIRYEQQIKEQQSHLQKEDLSGLVVEHISRSKSKRKRQQNQETKQAKKYKEFKF